MVPADRSQPFGDANRLNLLVARFHSAKQPPLPDAVVYLGGGPGGWTIESLAAGGADNLTGFLAERDVFVLDLRGTGYSTPRLDCPESENLRWVFAERQPSEAARRETWYDTLRTCHAAFVEQGIDWSDYTSAASAADAEDLRLALGAPPWNVFGGSYGARVALTLARDYPAGIRSLILDSPVPLQADSFIETPSNQMQALERVFAACAAQPPCQSAFPALGATLEQLVERLNRAPRLVQITDERTGRLVDIRIDGTFLLTLLAHGMDIPSNIGKLPLLIYDLAGDREGILAGLARYEYSAELFSEGVYYGAKCVEEWPFTTSEAVGREIEQGNPRLLLPSLPDFEALRQFCRDIGAAPAPALENQAVRSSIPALILSGALDARTPPSGARLIAADLERSRSLELPTAGHGVFGRSPCAKSLVRRFLDELDAPAEIDCVDLRAKLTFATR
ncbi:MAG TPA: alpha/beta hydrolase [Herpetosiphonaceae bacterium]